MRLIDRDALVCIGRVQGAHGMAGELKVLVLTGDPAWYAEAGGLEEDGLYLDGRQGLRQVRHARLHSQGGTWLLSLEGVRSREAAEAMTGDELLLEPARLKPLAADEFLLHELVGCAVFTTEGEALGTVRDVMETGANGVLWLEGPRGELAVPLTGDVVRSVDTAARRIEIEPLPGLLELNA